MILNALGQQPFPAALSPTGKGSTAAFAFHPGAKTVLAFTRAL
jgi:hypothetical protein